jgi:hypothetical protein
MLAEKTRQWRRKNPEKVKLQKKRGFQKLKERRKDDPILQEKWREKSRAYTARNPEKRRLISRRSILKRYGLTIDQYDQMLAEQNGLCAICHERKGSLISDRMAVDHDHKTGKVRALLCGQCNTLIGHIDDNIEWLESAIDYLKRHRSVER